MVLGRLATFILGGFPSIEWLEQIHPNGVFGKDVKYLDDTQLLLYIPERTLNGRFLSALVCHEVLKCYFSDSTRCLHLLRAGAVLRSFDAILSLTLSQA